MAIDIGTCMTGTWDLYCVLVELIFGNLMATYVALLLVIFLIGVITRTNLITIVYIIMIFSAFFTTFWWGAEMLFLWFVASALYFTWSILNYMRSRVGVA